MSGLMLPVVMVAGVDASRITAREGFRRRYAIGHLPDVKICPTVEPANNHGEPAFIGKKKMQDVLAEAELFLQPASVISQLLRGGSRIQHFTLEQYFDRVSSDRCCQHSSSKVAGLDFVGRELCRRLRVEG